MFDDRVDAGRRLAARLSHLAAESPLVLGLTRGGVPVALAVARQLGAELDVWVVRKLGCPAQPELGLGALSEGGELVIDAALAEATGTSAEALARVAAREAAEVASRVARYRGGRPRPEIRGRTVVLVDDGVATGGTTRAALRALRRLGPRRLVLAVPVGATEALRALAAEADEIACVEPAANLMAVGSWYEDFEPVSDQEVHDLLEEAARLGLLARPPAAEAGPR